MLPYLKKHKPAGITQEISPQDYTSDQDQDAGLDACAQDLKDAINNNDIKGITNALRAFFEIVDSQPHEEGPHTLSDQLDHIK